LVFSDPQITYWSPEKEEKKIHIAGLHYSHFSIRIRNVAVGADTYAYYMTFEHVKQMSWTAVFEAVTKYYKLWHGKDPGFNV